jgi:hypothetical protein
MSLSIEVFTGEYFSDPDIRNCYVTFYSEDFDLDNDLIVVQLYQNFSEINSKEYKVFKSKKSKKIKSYVVPPTAISKNVYKDYEVFSSEIFLDDFDHNFENIEDKLFYKVDAIVFYFKNFKDNKLYKDLKKNYGNLDLNSKWREGNISWSEFDYALTSLYITEKVAYTKPEDFHTSLDDKEYVDIDYFDSFHEAAINEFISSNLDLYDNNEDEYEEDEYEEDEYEEDEYLNPLDTYVQKYNLESIYELKYFFFLSLGVYLANIDDEFSISEKKLIKDILSEQISPTRVNTLIQTVEKRLQDNQLIISEIISEVNSSLLHWEVVEIVNNLYALISVDGIASTQEIEFLDKITDSLHVDFQYKNEIKTKQLLNVDIEDDKTSFAILDIDFTAPENIQIQQAEDGIIKWNGRLNTLTDPKERTNAQNFINKYSEFIKQKRTAQNTNSQKKKLTTPSKTSSKWDLLEPLDFPIPPKSTSEEINKIRKKHPRHRARWSVSEEEMLIKLYKENYSISQIASGLQRTDDAIENKIEKLKLI